MLQRHIGAQVALDHYLEQIYATSGTIFALQYNAGKQRSIAHSAGRGYRFHDSATNRQVIRARPLHLTRDIYRDGTFC